MGYIELRWDQESGKFEGANINGTIRKYEEWENATDNIGQFEQFPFVQHEHVEFYHKEGSSICAIHVGCKLVKWC